MSIASRHVLVPAVGAVLSLGCGAPTLELPREQERPTATLEPEASGSAVSSVVRFHVAPAEGSDVGELLLFSGEITAYHERRIAQGELPATLEERRVPIVRYVSASAGATVVVPTVRLAPGPHALVSGTYGTVLTVDVGEDDGADAIASRLWPPGEADTSGQHVVYCGARLSAVTGAEVVFQPGDVEGRVRRATGDGSGQGCVWIEVDEQRTEGLALVPPRVLGGVVLEPGSVRAAAGGSVAPAACVLPEEPLGLGCARVQDDRVIVRSPPAPVLWWATRAGAAPGDLVRATSGGESWGLLGLQPSAPMHLSVEMADPSGDLHRVEADVVTAAARDHVVIDEVLANPIGAEPAQEWVELVNDGTRGVSLEGWFIEDSAGGVRVPAEYLEAGERALVVREDFVRPNEPDVVVPPETRLIRVPSIGRNGISNGGEALRLVDASGRVVSTFPAIAAKDPGVSIVRLSTWTPDEDLWAFGPHEPPGASPGAAGGPSEAAL